MAAEETSNQKTEADTSTHGRGNSAIPFYQQEGQQCDTFLPTRGATMRYFSIHRRGNQGTEVRENRRLSEAGCSNDGQRTTGAYNHLRGKDSAFLISSHLNEDDIVRLAVGLYALYRTVNHYRFSGEVPTTHGVIKLLRSFCRRALDQQASFRLLLP